ncbi:MAG: hypothetical protein RIC19_03905 [Phaeodactylibacter sp.]|uniref:hypothetical protein n=1 Tax=Phaeodactylibacter sp. TaxID=1940289 RepID=UPI0032EF4B9E
MNRLSLLLILAIGLWSGCNKDDDDQDCTLPVYTWNTPTFESQGNWFWLTDAGGEIRARTMAESQSSVLLQPESCTEQPNLNFLQITSTAAADNTARTVFNLTTLLNAPDGLVWDTLPAPAPVEWEVAVNGVSSLETLLWPAESKEIFGGDIFIDPAADLLSFALQVPEGAPAYATIQANGEGTPRYLWAASANDDAFTFEYNTLPIPVEAGPISLPNTRSWRYRVFGQGPDGEAVLDYSSMPDLVSGSFAPLVPASLPGGFRLLAQEENTFEGLPFSANRYNKIVGALPGSIPATGAQFNLERAADTLRVSTTGDAPAVYVLQITDYRGEGPWLRWTIYGTPEMFENLVLPQWPEVFANNRSALLGSGRQTLALLSARFYDTRPAYGQIIEAQAQQLPHWEAEQGLLERTRAFLFQP